jgi:hypothetical protein
MHFKRTHKQLAPPEWLDTQVRAAMSAQAREGAGPSRQLSGEPGSTLPPAGGGPAAPATDKALHELQQETQQSIKVLAGFVFAFGLQTTGVALENRADRLSFQALVFAQRSESVMRGVQAFNAAMRSGELVELGSSLAMSMGVDVGLLHPAKQVKMGPFKVPGFVFLQPIAQDMQQVTQLREQAERMAREYEAQLKSEPNGRTQEVPAG